jgi:negative regulator of sigma E activity
VSRQSWPRNRPQLLSAAASLAAVALVGWVAFSPLDEAAPAAQAPAAVAHVVPPAAQAPAPMAQVLPPDTANDYLYAHQGYSPRNSLQGVAPYVRMVSGTAGAQKR